MTRKLTASVLLLLLGLPVRRVHLLVHLARLYRRRARERGRRAVPGESNAVTVDGAVVLFFSSSP